MKKVELSDGRAVLVGIHHGEEDVPAHLLPAYGSIKVRATEVFLKELGGKLLARATSFCSPRDNFCRRTGRRTAANKLLGSLRRCEQNLGRSPGHLTRYPGKEDRRRIFLAVCPEFSGTS